MSENYYVTRDQLRLVEERMDRRMDALHATIKETPDKVVSVIEEKRRADRRQFVKDSLSLLFGTVSALASIATAVYFVIQLAGGR